MRNHIGNALCLLLSFSGLKSASTLTHVLGKLPDSEGIKPRNPRAALRRSS
jgi:hypothetical protein